MEYPNECSFDYEVATEKTLRLALGNELFEALGKDEVVIKESDDKKKYGMPAIKIVDKVLDWFMARKGSADEELDGYKGLLDEVIKIMKSCT